jgi:signal transduction histidine kinase
MLGFACDQPMEHKDLMEVLGESRQASQRTYDLLENVLGWVRGQIEEVAALRERLPIRRALVSVQVWLEATAKAKGIHLHIECPENLSVIGDERMVETIVRNLVSNAMKYSPKGGTVVLQGRADGTHVLIEIIDQGTGMPPEKLEGLFLSQQKKSQPGTAGEGGSGLGLMFSSDLAKTLGGRLEAESVLGKGSTFRIVLPDEVDGEL